jgi:hypothetical protein
MMMGKRSLVLTQSTHHFTSAVRLLQMNELNETHSWNGCIIISRRKKFIFVNHGSGQQKENNFMNMKHMQLCYAIELPSFE